MKNQHLLTFQMIILMVSTFLYMCSISMSNPIMAGLCGQMGGKGAIMGVVSGLSSFVALFFRPFFGDLIDRQDRRKLSLVGSAFMTLGGILCATAPAITLLLLGRFCLCVIKKQ